MYTLPADTTETGNSSQSISWNSSQSIFQSIVTRGAAGSLTVVHRAMPCKGSLRRAWRVVRRELQSACDFWFLRKFRNYTHGKRSSFSQNSQKLHFFWKCTCFVNIENADATPPHLDVFVRLVSSGDLLGVLKVICHESLSLFSFTIASRSHSKINRKSFKNHEQSQKIDAFWSYRGSWVPPGPLQSQSLSQWPPGCVFLQILRWFWAPIRLQKSRKMRLFFTLLFWCGFWSCF